MPLKSGSTPKIISENIKREIDAGRKPRQAIAIAENMAHKEINQRAKVAPKMPRITPRRGK